MDTDRSEWREGSERLIHGKLTERLIRHFYEVCNELGGGFVESVYSGAYDIALRDAGIPFERERGVEIRFRGKVVGVGRPDFIVAGAVVIECKAVKALEEWQLGQVLHYLRATGLHVGLLLNFGPRPTVRRVLLTPDRQEHRDHG
jgi:GxxExxY protein